MHRLVAPLALSALVACGGTSSPAPSAEPSPTEAVLPADGTRYDPPIDSSEVPEGAWMCDMGTVHYAAPQDGECPVCGMKLVQKK